jgi:hypothetical protein
VQKQKTVSPPEPKKLSKAEERELRRLEDEKFELEELLAAKEAEIRALKGI